MCCAGVLVACCIFSCDMWTPNWGMWDLGLWSGTEPGAPAGSMKSQLLDHQGSSKPKNGLLSELLLEWLVMAIMNQIIVNSLGFSFLLWNKEWIEIQMPQ